LATNVPTGDGSSTDVDLAESLHRVLATLTMVGHERVSLTADGPLPVGRRRTHHVQSRIDRPSPPLRLGVRPAPQTYPFSAGDQMLALPDGLVEARTRQERFLDPAQVFGSLPDVSVRELLDRLIADLERHAGGSLGDDLVALVE
jgi:hypothetical protein